MLNCWLTMYDVQVGLITLSNNLLTDFLNRLLLCRLNRQNKTISVFIYFNVCSPMYFLISVFIPLLS